MTTAHSDGNLARPPRPSRPRAHPSDLLFRPSERFFLDADSPVPLYHQMEQIVLDRLVKEDAVGKMLPRELDLVKIFGVSRATVKKVTDSLSAKGLIHRKRSVGTQIVHLGVVEDLAKLTSYSEQMAARGMHVSTEVVGVSEHTPDRKVREQLRLRPEDRTLCIRRLRGTSAVFPVVLLQSEIPVSFGVDPGEDFHGSLYKILEQRYRIPIEWGEEEIGTGRATADEASRLRISEGDPVLVMQRTTYTRGKRPLEFVRAVYRPEHYTFSIRLKR